METIVRQNTRVFALVSDVLVRTGSTCNPRAVDVKGITFVAPGWVEIELEEADGKTLLALAKLADSGGRGVITHLLLISDSLTANTLRAVPLGRIPAFNAVPGAQLTSEQLEEFAARNEVFPVEFSEIDSAISAYLERRPLRTGRVVVTKRKTKRKPLGRPDGSDPDGFSRLVAEAYTDAVLATSSPAIMLAEEAGVPVGTIHRWVRDARQRGHLPPARKGRAG